MSTPLDVSIAPELAGRVRLGVLVLESVTVRDADEALAAEVDALNLCALRFQLPFGLYDLDRVAPPVVLRRGAAGEAYEGIRKAQVNVEGRPVLVDAQGPFGNPTSDSARTMITTQTRHALVTVYAPAGYGLGRLEKVLDGTEATLTRACSGSRTLRQILPPA